MGQVIFSVDLLNHNVFLSNNKFKKLFTQIKDIPYEFSKDKEISSLVKIAEKSLFKGDLGRIFFDKDEKTYSFEVDKIDEKTLVLSGKMLDEEEHIKNEEALKLLRLMSDNLPDMLWAKDVEGKYIFANKAICDNLLMAKDTQEPIGKNDDFFAIRERDKHKDKEDWHTFGELCSASDDLVLENMKPMRFEEYGNVKGKLIYLEVNKAPFFDEDGRLIGTVGSGRDITQEVLTKNKLEEKDQLLLQQSKMAAVGEMLQNIAHQWRQPLSTISTLSTSVILQKQIDILDDDYLLHSMHTLNNSAQYLSSTIDDFRDFFKPNKEKSIFNLKDIEEKVLSLISAKIKKNKINIVSKIEDIQINGYQNEFIQVLINVINNAIDALSDVKTKRFVFIKSQKIEDGLLIKIKDNAGGIPEDIISNVFQPYFTTKHQSKGTGIGLYMCEEIITKHMNGLISVRNERFLHEGERCKGALFTIELKN